jgi:hypothetical protein
MTKSPKNWLRSVEAELTMIVDRCQAASPAPWRAWVEGRDGLGGTSIIKTGADEDIEVSPAAGNDLDLIAAARSDITKLARAVRGERSAAASADVRRLAELVARATPGPRHIGVYSSPPRTYPTLVIGGVEIPITGASLQDLIFMVTCRDDTARLLELLADAAG